jgi:hypothetical protein
MGSPCFEANRNIVTHFAIFSITILHAATNGRGKIFWHLFVGLVSWLERPFLSAQAKGLGNNGGNRRRP